MTSVVFAGGCLPTPEQELLLHAALVENDTAVAAWREWQTRADFDALDWGSYRLMPLVYRNLKALQVEDELLGRLRGIHRRTWYENNLLLGELSALLRDFHAAGIRTLVLKGVALGLLYYADLGLRPMLDFDVLVPFADKARALVQTRAGDWEEKFHAPHACGFNTTRGNEFDLHWHAFAECCQANADDGLWAGAVPFQLGEIQTLTLNPTDMLLHVCVHGWAWNAILPVRWIADALMILRATPIDWTRFVTQARQRQLTLTARSALGYLTQMLDAPVPPRVLNELAAISITRAERWDYAAKTHPPTERGVLLVSWAYLREYHRLVMNENIARKIFSFPRFIQTLWGVKHVWQLPYYAFTGAAERIGKWLRRGSKHYAADSPRKLAGDSR